MLSSREKISIRQAIILFLMFVYSVSIRIFPAYSAKAAGRAGWLSPVPAVLPFICLVYIIQALFKNDREASLSDIIYKTLGKFFGTVLLLLNLIWQLIALGIIVRNFAERFLSSLLPSTPPGFFTATMLAVVFFTLRGGIVNISRTAEFLFILITGIFIVLFVLSIPNFEIINLFPVTYYDALPILQASYSNIGMWSIFTFIFFFADKVSNKEQIKRFGLQSTAYLAIMALMLLIQTIGTYGYSVIERVPLAYSFVIKSISVLDTIERIESIAVVSWVIADFITISVTLYIIVNIIKSLFSLSDVKPFISPVTIFAFIFSFYIAQNKFELEKFTNTVSMMINLILGFVSPLIVLIVGRARGKLR